MQHIVTSAGRIEQRLRSAWFGTTFHRAVVDFTHLLETVHRQDGRNSSGDIEALGAVADHVVELIETRLDRHHDRQSVRRDLAGAVYAIRREVERIHTASKEVSWRDM